MSVIFLNSHRAKSGLVNGKKLPEDYVLTCKFFDCGIIDRTESLDHGFDYKVLDPIPVFNPHFNASFTDICDAEGRKIVEESKQTGKKIQVLWSGGIDSTVALIALLRASEPNHIATHFEVLASMKSIDEYPLFFRNYILNKVPFRPIAPPITQRFDQDALIVTGEHGDQLFGSDKLLPLIKNGLAYEKYEDVMPIYLIDKFGQGAKTDRLLNYLQPLIKACPQAIETAYDLFWWLNYTIKWQQVSLRLPVFTFQEDVQLLTGNFRHFFRAEDFQQWSLGLGSERISPNLITYKQQAKQYILDFTGDRSYWEQKSKEPSLQHVIVDRKTQGSQRYRVLMETDYKPIIEVFHKKYKNQNISE